MRWERLCRVADTFDAGCMQFDQRHKAWKPLLNALNDDTVAGLKLKGDMLYGHAWACTYLVCTHASINACARCAGRSPRPWSEHASGGKKARKNKGEKEEEEKKEEQVTVFFFIPGG